MFNELCKINSKPAVWSVYTAEKLWNDEYTSSQMLQYHINPDVDISSRKINFIEKSVDWIKDQFSLSESSTICDFGCGPGLYTSRFAQLGAKITGIDFSENSIRYAMEEAKNLGLSIDYINGNYLDVELDQKFDLITLIMCDFCALNPSQRLSLLRKFKAILNEGGSILFDVYTLHAFDKRQEVSEYSLNQLNHFWSPNDYYGFLNTFKYEKEKVVLDKYSIYEKDRDWTVYNWLQYFDYDMLKAEVESVGFTISGLYADVAGTPFEENTDEMAIVLNL